MIDLKDLKNKGIYLKPIVNIGKNGLTPGLLMQIEKALKKNKLIKIKINQGALDTASKKELAADLAKKTKSELIDLRGFNIVIFYKKISEDKPKSGLEPKKD